MRGFLVTAVLSLAVGIGVLFNWTHGSTGFSFAYPISGSSLHIEMTTTGMPAVAGFALTVLGAFLLIVATILALIGRRRINDPDAPTRRRDTAFEE